MSAWAVLLVAAALGALGGGAIVAGAVAMRRRALSEPLHELRGALAALQLGLFALERRGPLTAVGERIDALRTQAERAHVAVEDIDAARALRRPEPGRVEPVEVGTLVKRRVAAWSRLGEARRRSVELRWALGPAIVRVDPGRLGQALDNLIVNALDHGSGIVRVSGALREEAIRIAVSDQGPGFGKALSELPRPTWRDRHGHGLAVAARAAELSGGRLTAASGRIGSRVEIELPLAGPRGRGAAPTAQVPSRGAARRIAESA